MKENLTLPPRSNAHYVRRCQRKAGRACPQRGRAATKTRNCQKNTKISKENLRLRVATAAIFPLCPLYCNSPNYSQAARIFRKRTQPLNTRKRKQRNSPPSFRV